MKEFPITTEQISLFGEVVPFNKHNAAILLYKRYSPSRMYCIAWGNNDYYVFDTCSNRLLAKGHRCIELFDAYIANNGSFLLEEWLDRTTLSSRVTIKSILGNTVYKQEFPINILGSTLSENGLFASVQLCGGSGPFANNLVIIDLRTESRLAATFPIQPDVNGVASFDSENDTVSLSFNNCKEYRYSITGTFIDKEKYMVYAESKYTGAKAFQTAKKHYANISSTNIADYKNVLDLINRSLLDILSVPMRANVYRLLGDIQLKCGNKAIAINAYKTALSINPKVGVKTLLKNLAKE